MSAVVSSFDTGRRPCPQGGEDRWSARWLMDQMGYDKWQNFEQVIERAKVASHNQGFNVRTLFTAVSKKGDGRPQTDYLVTRFAAYLIAMNGDPRKSEVSAAQHYFAVKAREAEVAVPLTDDELIHRALSITARRVEALTERVAELEPKAEVADKLLDAAGDLSVRDAAQALTRAGIEVGATRLFAELERRGWIRRSGEDGRYRVLQSAIETGYMSVLPQSHEHPKTGVRVLDPPQPRVRPKGIQRLLADYAWS
ncbi:phage antirepressor KilAC domain-containing protein [Mycobacterium sp. NPDC050853]|uniref:phage antirepressor KilAC domain-containing protein n=1 Tax=Mycobacterium sp. NPDC050853 TaxID=3155160 RepID=UPI0033D9CB7A